MRVSKRIWAMVFVLLYLQSSLTHAVETIQFLSKEDQNFTRIVKEIDQNYQRLAQRKAILPLSFYFYRAKKGESIYTIAARLNLNYDSLASLNNLASPALLEENILLMIPNLPAIYLRETNEEALFADLANRLEDKDFFSAIYTHPLSGEDEVLRVYPNQRFSPQERYTFMSGFFLWPITGERIITSDYGRRLDPIAHQNYHHHNGIDLRLALGSPVHASRQGTVVESSYNNILGVYIIIRHAQGFETVYGHLTRSLVQVGDSVKAGQRIAMSGNTGFSTGPHLHFEIRKDGKAIDPKPFFIN